MFVTWWVLLWFTGLNSIVLNLIARFTPNSSQGLFVGPSANPWDISSDTVLRLTGISIDLNGKHVPNATEIRPTWGHVEMGFHGIWYAYSVSAVPAKKVSPHSNSSFGFGLEFEKIFEMYPHYGYGGYHDLVLDTSPKEAIQRLGIAQDTLDYGETSKRRMQAAQAMIALSAACVMLSLILMCVTQRQAITLYLLPFGCLTSLISSILILATLTTLRNNINSHTNENGVTAQLVAPLPIVSCLGSFAAVLACWTAVKCRSTGVVHKAKRSAQKAAEERERAAHYQRQEEEEIQQREQNQIAREQEIEIHVERILNKERAPPQYSDVAK